MNCVQTMVYCLIRIMDFAEIYKQLPLFCFISLALKSARASLILIFVGVSQCHHIILLQHCKFPCNMLLHVSLIRIGFWQGFPIQSKMYTIIRRILSTFVEISQKINHKYLFILEGLYLLNAHKNYGLGKAQARNGLKTFFKILVFAMIHLTNVCWIWE